MGYGRFTPCGMKKPLPERPEEKTIDLFQVKGTKLSPLDRVPAKLEREIQRLLEANLETVFGIHMLASEYHLCQHTVRRFMAEKLMSMQGEIRSA